jgi:hypothetical protein
VYSSKIRTSGNRTSGDRTSGGPPVISTDQAKAIAHWKYFGSGGSALRKKVFEKYRQRVKLRWRGYCW